MDLVKYETGILDESAGPLAVGGDGAGHPRHGDGRQRAALVIRQQFPVHPTGGLGDTLSRAIEGAAQTGLRCGSGPARRAAEAEEVLHATSDGARPGDYPARRAHAQPVGGVGSLEPARGAAALPRPFREQIGNLVYGTATAFGEVNRKDVVPGYAEEVAAAVAVRATVADLTPADRRPAARRCAEAEPEDVQWNAQQMEKELDTFGRTPAYRGAARAGQAADHRVPRRRARLLAQPRDVRSRELLGKVEPFAEFVVSARRGEPARAADPARPRGLGRVRRRARAGGQLMRQDPDAGRRRAGEARAAAQASTGADAASTPSFARRASIHRPRDARRALRTTLESCSGLHRAADGRLIQWSPAPLSRRGPSRVRGRLHRRRRHADHARTGSPARPCARSSSLRGAGLAGGAGQRPARGVGRVLGADAAGGRRDRGERRALLRPDAQGGRLRRVYAETPAVQSEASRQAAGAEVRAVLKHVSRARGSRRTASYTEVDLAIDYNEEADARAGAARRDRGASSRARRHRGALLGARELLAGAVRQAHRGAPLLQREWKLTLARADPRFVYAGDSFNDAPMFGAFALSVGVANVRRCLARLIDAAGLHHPGARGAGLRGACAARS